MTSEHLISLINANCNNIDDLKKIANAVECLIEAATLEESLKDEEHKPEPKTLKQMQAQKVIRANSIDGTSLKGRVLTTFNKLVAAFGEPCIHLKPSQYEKVTIEWKLRFPNGAIATIYDWKGYGYQPAGDEEYEWKIGGHSSQAVGLVKDALGLIHGSGPFFEMGN